MSRIIEFLPYGIVKLNVKLSTTPLLTLQLNVVTTHVCMSVCTYPEVMTSCLNVLYKRHVFSTMYLISLWNSSEKAEETRAMQIHEKEKYRTATVTSRAERNTDRT